MTAPRKVRKARKARKRRRGPSNERGAAVILALLIMVLLATIGAALVTLTTTDVLIASSHRHGLEASNAAEAALERALHELASLPDWSAALAAPPANVTATFSETSSFALLPDGRRLELAALTAERQRESDAREGIGAFGADAPRWRLFGHASTARLYGAGDDDPLYLLVWVADDGWDGDGDAERDTNGSVVVHAQAFGARGARRAVEAAVRRSGDGAIERRSWQRVR